MITVALFGDQPRNVKLAERHHFAINIRKGDISANALAAALNKLLNDKSLGPKEAANPEYSYSQNVKRLSQMVKKRPVSADHLLVAWSEFAAEFKTLENLVPAGTKLNFFQYHSLDVIAFMLTILAVIIFISWKLLKIVLLKIYASFSRVEKTKLS
ncbi:hypothetical protein TELCIR_02299 [Teladorsagia circumcincta]|uniref:glucuronosyltransferase n=1 Tax=Teladorsagia circumcincta TaxID=45464 RepID=A0A2G9UZJ2_TELCI|nr:hypothetical protein TELCIR_02299 [Teladorsagia circumcincta]